MRIIMKIIALPFALALTLMVAVLNFSVSLVSWVFGISGLYSCIVLSAIHFENMALEHKIVAANRNRNSFTLESPQTSTKCS